MNEDLMETKPDSAEGLHRASHTVMHSTNRYPVNLKTPDETASFLNNSLDVDRLVELAKSGYLPHYVVDGKELLFNPSEVRNWVGKNLTRKCDGQALPDEIRVLGPYRKPEEQPPIELACIVNLQQIDISSYCPGIYFLCLGRDVVYVGQSVTPMARIANHMESKKFDRVYFMPAPKTELDSLEASFIRLLDPAQQGRSSLGKVIAPRFDGNCHEAVAPNLNKEAR